MKICIWFGEQFEISLFVYEISGLISIAFLLIIISNILYLLFIFISISLLNNVIMVVDE